MLCENCHQNPATIHLYTNVNGTKREINLCQNCYQELKAQAEASNSAGDPFGFNSLESIFRAMNDNQQRAADSQGPQTQAGGQGPRPPRGGKNNGNSLLGQYGVNLTAQAKKGEIDPVIGRDSEIARVIEILNRRTKNNPVLIGEAGVGKTAVVEGLALKIANGDVPQKLQDRQVIQLDVVSLVQVPACVVSLSNGCSNC